jgi:hypothetical protein
MKPAALAAVAIDDGQQLAVNFETDFAAKAATGCRSGIFMLFWHINLTFFNSSSLRKYQEKEITHLGDKMSLNQEILSSRKMVAE